MRLMKDQNIFSAKKLNGYIDYKIRTDKKSPQQIAEEIFGLYLDALEKRGLKRN